MNRRRFLGILSNILFVGLFSDRLLRQTEDEYIVKTGDTTGGNDVDINFNNGQIFVDDSSGRLGFGDTSPAAILDVNEYLVYDKSEWLNYKTVAKSDEVYECTVYDLKEDQNA